MPGSYVYVVAIGKDVMRRYDAVNTILAKIRRFVHNKSFLSEKIRNKRFFFFCYYRFKTTLTHHTYGITHQSYYFIIQNLVLLERSTMNNIRFLKIHLILITLKLCIIDIQIRTKVNKRIIIDL